MVESQSQILNIKPRYLKQFLKNHGWTEKFSNGTQSQFRKYNSSGKVIEITIPIDENVGEFNTILSIALEKLSEEESMESSKLINFLSLRESDIVSFRIVDDSTKEGFIDLNTATKYFSSCEKLLLTSALSVDTPSLHHSKLSKPILKNFSKKCRLNTSPGSFTINIFCPLDAVETAEISKEALNLMRAQSLNSFTRATTTFLLKTCELLIDNIEKGEIDRFIENTLSLPSLSNQVEYDFKPNSNFYRHLLSLQPQSGNALLEINGLTTFGTPIVASKRKIEFKQDYFSDIQRIADSLSPQSESENRLIVGRVSALSGEPTENNSPAGEIEITTEFDEELLRAKMTLNVEQYKEAILAHSYSQFVSLRGDLRIGSRTSKIDNVTDFKIVISSASAL